MSRFRSAASKPSKFRRPRRLHTVEPLEQRFVLAAPVAVNDSFNVQEDNALAVIPFALNADFEVPPDATLVGAGATWQYLDKIQLSQSYPTDALGRTWNSLDFDVATSTAAIGAWEIGTTPLQGGGINAFPGAPSVLDGIPAGGGQQATVNTYLFRHVFEVTEAQASEAEAAFRVLCDDGCVGYINGVRVFGVNMTNTPAGSVTTNSFADDSDQTEDSYTTISRAVSALNLQVGTNVLAVEVHQSDLNSSDIGFDAQLVIGDGGTAGFSYVDDVLSTNRADLASGTVDPAGGFTGGGITVRLNQGGGFGGGSPQSSGGFIKTFNVPGAGTAQLSLRYRLRQGGGHDNGEFGEAVLTIDGVRYGTALNNSLIHREGTTNGGYDSQWQLATFDVPLTAGNHTLMLGGYNTSSGGGFNPNEWSQVYFDDISITFSGGATGVLDNDTDADGNLLTASLVAGSGPTNGTLTFNANGSFVYTPAANWSGTDSFQYLANDGTANSTPATVTINVAAVNDPPLGTAKAYSVAEDTQLQVAVGQGLLVGASDVDNPVAALSAVQRQAPANGTVTIAPDGSFTYMPNANFAGTDSFRFAVFDGTSNSSDITVLVDVTPVNDAPTTVTDNYTVIENTTLVADRLIPSTSAILLPRQSRWRYLDNGTDQGTAWRTDQYDDSAWVQENAAGNNGAEYGYGDQAENRPEQTVVGFGGNTNNRYITTYFRKNFNIADVNAITGLTVRLMRDDGAAVFINGVEAVRDNLPANAAYNTVASDFASENDEFTFFEFNVSPSLLKTGQNLIAVEIHQNSVDSSDISFDLELAATVIDSATGVLVNDRDPENDPFTATVIDNPAHGTLVFNPNGTFTYTPDPNYQGPDSFTYRASDGTATSATTTVNITVTPGPNDIPIAAPDAYSLDEDGVLVVSTIAAGLLGNDTDGELDPLVASVHTPPANGVVSINEDGTFTYTPNADFFGVDTFKYRAFDGSDYSVPGTVTITVNGVEDAPIAVNDQYFVTPDVQLAVPSTSGLRINDREPDGQAMTASLVAAPAVGTLNLLPSGAFTYRPPTGFRGVTSFTYRVSDGSNFSNIATVTLVVDGRPTASNDAYVVDEDAQLSVNSAQGVLQGDADPENDALTAVVLTQPANGILSFSANGSFTYTPNGNFFGVDSFTYAANDGDQLSTPATVTITVNPINDGPTGVADVYDVEVNVGLSTNVEEGVLANDLDIDSATLSATLAPGGGPQFGQLTLNANGSFSYIPNAEYIGPDSFTYIPSDGSLAGQPTTVTLNVTSASDLVLISEIMYHPSSENDAEEYIELVNLGIGNINLQNWQFDQGVSFTFPAVSIAGGGRLVIAANVAAFTAKYPSVTNVVGGWTGQLSNSGEDIRLVDKNGNEIDEVEYADAGDWAVRREVTDGQEQGWDWIAEHDGGGRSLELINTALPNEFGGNWGPSITVQGTPGAANSIASNASAPLVSEVIHSPAVPKTGETVFVTARLTDVEGSTVTGIVRYRVSTANPGAFQEAPMFDDGQHGDGAAGDGLYGATLPAQTQNLTVVEFYVFASNNAGLSRTWPGPTTAGGAQGANLLYQVDNSVYAGDQPVYRIIMTAADNTDFNGNGWNDQSNAQKNATFINVDGSGTEIVYNVGVRRRGSGSRGRAVPNLRVNFPSDRIWQNVSGINLNTQYTFTQLLGMRIFELAGMPFEEATAVQVHMNGTNRSTEARQSGSHVRLETPGSEWADNHYPNDSNGNFYRPDGGFGGDTSDLEYFGENPNAYSTLYNKQTNATANDYTDIIALTRALDPTATPNEAFVSTVKQVIDVDQWMRFFALNTLLVNEENGLINGEADDYSLYRGVIDPRFDLVVHDLDSIFPASTDVGDTVGSATRNILNELRQNPRLARLFDQPEFLNLYYFHLIDLADKIFTPSVLEPLIDNSLASWVPTSYIQAMKTFAQDRVAYVRSQVPAVSIPPVATVENEPLGVTPLTSASLTVGGAGVTAYRYRVNNGAWSGDIATENPISLTGLTNGTYTVSVIGRNAAGTFQSTDAPTVSRTWTVNTAMSALRISEVLADNTTLGHEGTLPDMIELFNASANTINLAGMRISDNATNPDKFVFPAGTSIAPGEYLVLYADSANTSGTHLGFSLERSGEGVYLYNTVASGGALLDSVEFGMQLPDRSISRDATFQWRLSNPTLGGANNSFVGLGNVNGLRINEWLADGKRLFNDDLIELYNSQSLPVALGGLYLTDNPNGYPNKHQIAPNSFIAGQGFAVFVADENAENGGDHINFRLSADRESIALLDRHLRRIDTVIFAPQKSDVSQGRTTEGSSLYSYFSPPTFGLPNASSSTLPDPLALLDHLRITELMYNPAGDAGLEYIELQNTGTTTLNLTGVRLRNGVDFTFPAMTLAPGAYTVVVADAVKFAARYPGVAIAGQYQQSLNNGGENVELALPVPFDANILDFTYDDAWAPKTDGLGHSLVVTSATAGVASWDVSAGWRQSYSIGGSPGRADLLLADQDGNGSVGVRDLIQLRNKLGTADLTGDLNFDGVVNSGDLAALMSAYAMSAALPGGSPAASSAVVMRAARDNAIADGAIADSGVDSGTPLVVRPRRAAVYSGETAATAQARRTLSRTAVDSVLLGDDTLSVQELRSTRSTARAARIRSR